MNISRFMKSKGIDKQNYKVIGTGGTYINYLNKDRYYSKFPQSVFILSSCNINEWIKDAINEINSAETILIQNDDNTPGITGYTETSYERIIQIPIFNNILKNDFVKDTVINNFVFYRRIRK
ncbi:MAG: hypothetical protein HW421_1764 [Ignavibacteria bacterium]|nr:hypothetical protein [Ignavibacteria bacterium]